jgi:NADPH oxidase
MYFLLPGFLYAGERIYRLLKGSLNSTLIAARPHPSKVLELRFQVPGFNYKSGQYLFICFPHIFPHEWHPFTITSSPDEDFISLHIRVVGDWTGELWKTLVEGADKAEYLNTPTGPDGQPVIQIDGPFGTAAGEIEDYKVVVLVGAGIGVTPFASILKHLKWMNATKAKTPLEHIYFYWINREKESFEWFLELLTDLERYQEKTGTKLLDLNAYLTEGFSASDIKALMYDDREGDTFTGLHSKTHIGRPNWAQIFPQLAQKHKGETIGVFLCGPAVLAVELSQQSLKNTVNLPGETKFKFQKENF